jgi:TolA-binding protein
VSADSPGDLDNESSLRASPTPSNAAQLEQLESAVETLMEELSVRDEAMKELQVDSNMRKEQNEELRAGFKDLEEECGALKQEILMMTQETNSAKRELTNSQYVRAQTRAPSKKSQGYGGCCGRGRAQEKRVLLGRSERNEGMSFCGCSPPTVPMRPASWVWAAASLGGCRGETP